MTAPRRPPVSMQITLIPSDLEEAQHLLPHQLRTWGRQVDEVLCLVDVPPSLAEHEETRQGLASLGEFLDQQASAHPHLSWRLVDYSPEAVATVESTFYGGRPAPVYDYRDRPIYAYLHLLLATRHDFVFHIDGDMMFGGGSQTWMGEALDLLATRPDLLCCHPLSGPPRADGRLMSQRYRPTPDPELPNAYLFPTLSYRAFVLDRRVLADRLAPLRDEWPSWRRTVRALARRRRRPHALLEQVLARAMMRERVYRLDFLGSAPGMWSLHPRYRTPRYKRALPDLIRLVEAGAVPQAQRGEYDLLDAMLEMAEPVGIGV